MVDALSEWSPREVFALVEGLPDTSRLHARFAGGERWREFVGWGQDRHMSADLWDLTVAANTDAKKRAAKYPRPAAKKPEKGVNTLLSMFPLRKE